MAFHLVIYWYSVSAHSRTINFYCSWSCWILLQIRPIRTGTRETISHLLTTLRDTVDNCLVAGGWASGDLQVVAERGTSSDSRWKKVVLLVVQCTLIVVSHGDPCDNAACGRLAIPVSKEPRCGQRFLPISKHVSNMEQCQRWVGRPDACRARLMERQHEALAFRHHERSLRHLGYLGINGRTGTVSVVVARYA